MPRRALLLLAALVSCGAPRAPVGDPLPAPRRLVTPKLGPALAEAKGLADRLLATPRDPVDRATTAAQLRSWALEGWMPMQGRRRALFMELEASLPTSSDLAGAALLEGRAMESLAEDWTALGVVECETDPAVCAMAARVATNARQAWLDRARERYQTCAAFAREDADLEDLCAARADALRKRAP